MLGTYKNNSVTQWPSHPEINERLYSITAAQVDSEWAISQVWPASKSNKQILIWSDLGFLLLRWIDREISGVWLLIHAHLGMDKLSHTRVFCTIDVRACMSCHKWEFYLDVSYYPCSNVDVALANFCKSSPTEEGLGVYTYMWNISLFTFKFVRIAASSVYLPKRERNKHD